MSHRTGTHTHSVAIADQSKRHYDFIHLRARVNIDIGRGSLIIRLVAIRPMNSIQPPKKKKNK
jgi:hypothetical protein